MRSQQRTDNIGKRRGTETGERQRKETRERMAGKTGPFPRAVSFPVLFQPQQRLIRASCLAGNCLPVPECAYTGLLTDPPPHAYKQAAHTQSGYFCTSFIYTCAVYSHSCHSSSQMLSVGARVHTHTHTEMHDKTNLQKYLRTL